MFSLFLKLSSLHLVAAAASTLWDSRPRPRGSRQLSDDTTVNFLAASTTAAKPKAVKAIYGTRRRLIPAVTVGTVTPPVLSKSRLLQERNKIFKQFFETEPEPNPDPNKIYQTRTIFHILMETVRLRARKRLVGPGWD